MSDTLPVMRTVTNILPETTTINHAGLFHDILALDIHHAPLSLCLASASRNEQIPRFARIEMTEDLADNFRTTIRTFLHPYMRDMREENLSFPAMGIESKPQEYEIETLDLTGYQPILDQIDPLSSLSHLDLFDNDEKFVAGMRFYVAVMQFPEGDDPVYFFRVHTQRKVLSRSLLLALFDNEGRYDTVKKSVMAFDQDFDCIYRSGVLFILHKENFQRIFRFFETIKHEARQTLATIAASVPIVNLEELIAAVEGNVAM